MYVPK